MNFSVLMSVYIKETPSNLKECFDSLVSQTLKAQELVLVEDGPLSDELLGLISDYREVLNIHSVKLEKNIGLSAALNKGLQQCKHDLVARMDTDDIALPDRFKIQVDFMSAHAEIDASSGFIEEFNGEGTTVAVRELPLDSDAICEFSKQRSPLSHPAVILRKKAVEAVGGYPNLYPEDYLLWVKMIMNGSKLANVPNTLLKMRTDESFITRRGYDFLKGEIKIYQFMKEEGFISPVEYTRVVILRTFLRLSPSFIKTWLYRFAR